MKTICKIIMKITGWRSVGSLVTDPKCILIGAPHTSSLDFVISWIFYKSHWEEKPIF
jgi:hypothetical protein